MHDRYSVQIDDKMSQYDLFDVLGKMLAELKDGHTNLFSSFDVARYWAWYEDYPANFDSDIQKNYLGTDYKIAGGLKYKCLSDNQVGYVYYGNFSSGVGESNLDNMFLHFKDCKGIIFDVRNNGGGAMSNSDRITQRFLEEKILTGYVMYKKGNGHKDVYKRQGRTDQVGATDNCFQGKRCLINLIECEHYAKFLRRQTYIKIEIYKRV